MPWLEHVVAGESDTGIRTFPPGTLVIPTATPGTHTVELGVAVLLERTVSRFFNDATPLPLGETDDLMVGWQQLEFDGSPR